MNKLITAAGSLLVAGAFLAATASAQTVSEPQFSGITVTPTNTGGSAMWNTDEPTNAQVLYGTSMGNYTGSTTLDTTTSTSHTEALTGLNPGTTYYYVVTGTDSSSNMNRSAEGTFMTTASTSTNGEPMLSGVGLTASDTEATITWTSDEPSSSNVAYGTTTPLTMYSGWNMSQVTNHSVMLTNLLPSTTYYFQVLSNDASNNLNASGLYSFTTTQSMNTGSTTGTTTGSTTGSTATSTASTTEPMFSMIMANPTDTGATITWNTDVNANAQVWYGTSSGMYTGSTTLDTGSMMNHSEMLTGLMPNTTYYYVVKGTDGSGNMNMSAEGTFMTLSSSTNTGTGSTSTTGTGTTTTGTVTLDQLQSELTALEAELAALFSHFGLSWNGTTIGGGSGSGNTGGAGTSGAAMIEQNGESVRAGTSLDFSGRNFNHEEQVTVLMNGTTVATAHADGGGNFSTGSFSAPTTPGTYTYTFSGQNGDSASASVTVTP